MKFKEFMWLAPITELVNADSKTPDPIPYLLLHLLHFYYILPRNSFLLGYNHAKPLKKKKNSFNTSSLSHKNSNSLNIFIIKPTFLLNVLSLLHALLSILDLVLLCASVCSFFLVHLVRFSQNDFSKV